MSASEPATREVCELEKGLFHVAKGGSPAEHFPEQFGIVGNDVVRAHAEHGVHEGDIVHRPDVDFQIPAVRAGDEVARDGGRANAENVRFQFGDIPQRGSHDYAGADARAGGAHLADALVVERCHNSVAGEIVLVDDAHDFAGKFLVVSVEFEFDIEFRVALHCLDDLRKGGYALVAEFGTEPAAAVEIL